MTKIIIEALPPEKMRLEAYREAGCGDWFVDPANGDIRIQVAAASEDVWDDQDAFLIAFHELCEAFLCARDGVTQGAVDSFDQQFTGENQPGDHPDAPYRKQHRAAMLLEHTLAILMGKYDYGRME